MAPRATRLNPGPLGGPWKMSEFWNEIRAQLLALVTFFAFPIIQYTWLKLLAKKTGEAEIWFLPEYQCCRLVLRNLPHRKILYDIRYRAVLRKIELPTDGASVESYRDMDIQSRDELFLFGEDDQVLVSFRVEGHDENSLELVVTDKFGVEQSRSPVASVDLLIADYAATIKNIFNFDIRIAKRAEVTRDKLIAIWRTLSPNSEEQCFYPDRLRSVS
jgi:hypothetical protein